MSYEEYEDFRVNYPSADTYRKALRKLGWLSTSPPLTLAFANNKKVGAEKKCPITLYMPYMAV